MGCRAGVHADGRPPHRTEAGRSLILIAGDVFHTVRPTNPAILHAFSQFSRLVRELPDAIVVMVAGNHDMPRSSETSCILRLFAPLGVHVVDNEPRSPPAFPEHDLFRSSWYPTIQALERGVRSRSMSVRHNVLLLAHGVVEGTLPGYAAHTDHFGLEIPREVVASPAWSYIALGHYHVYRRIGSTNAYYSGAVDFTSSNIWGEIEEQGSRRNFPTAKGMIERDLESGKQTFHRLPAAREFVDLPRIDGRGMSAPDLDAAIAASVAKVPGGVDGQVVRLVARATCRVMSRASSTTRRSAICSVAHSIFISTRGARK